MDHDLKERLLVPSRAASAVANGPHRRVTPAAGSGGGGGGGGGVAIDVHGLKRRGGGRRSWVRVDAATGASEAVEVAKPALMRWLDLPARDLRLLDPLFVYPSAILGRERAVVCNLERIRCIITADKALVLRDPEAAGGAAAEEDVRRYVGKLQRRLVDRADDLPFEFIALERSRSKPPAPSSTRRQLFRLVLPEWSEKGSWGTQPVRMGLPPADRSHCREVLQEMGPSVVLPSWRHPVCGLHPRPCRRCRCSIIVRQDPSRRPGA